MTAGDMTAMATLFAVTIVTCTAAPPTAKHQEKKASTQDYPDQPSVFCPHFPFLLYAHRVKSERAGHIPDLAAEIEWMPATCNDAGKDPPRRR